jgi:hypothetical protein
MTVTAVASRETAKTLTLRTELLVIIKRTSTDRKEKPVVLVGSSEAAEIQNPRLQFL